MNKVRLYPSLTLAAALLAGVVSMHLPTGSPLAQGQKTDAREKQREHGKLYKRYGSGDDLRKRAEKEAGDVVVIETPPVPFDAPGLPPFLNAITCDAEAVVVGTVTGKIASQFTEGGEFIFTDYEMAVEDVLKNNPAAFIQTNQSITVSQPGGEVKFNGKTVRAVDESFKSFAAGARYILFLRHVPSTGGYRAFSNGSFLLSDDKVLKLGEGTLWGHVKGDKSAFTEAVRDAVTGACPPSPQALR